MKSVLVTGANKGIGLAVVEAILREQPGYRVLLGSRDTRRGDSARETLVAENPDWSERVDVLALDVSSDRSVADARALLLAEAAGDPTPLHGLVNNAGLGSGALQDILNVNLRGIRRMCQVFAPLVEPGGRIVNVTSASGPNFVSGCDARGQAFFRDPGMTWERLEHYLETCGEPASRYGLSKACANSYTMTLARSYPELFVNACTPGFIETDLGREFLGSRTPAEAGMKTPAEGCRVILSLLFEEPRGSGHYYGSDGLRSPLDRYRAPGSPEFTDQ